MKIMKNKVYYIEIFAHLAAPDTNDLTIRLYTQYYITQNGIDRLLNILKGLFVCIHQDVYNHNTHGYTIL